jgi:hypothetical protein
MYEGRHEPLLPAREFIGRVLRHGGLAIAILVLSLAAGMLGYAGLEQLSPVDAFLNAAMILGGMGPVATMQTPAGKIFAGLYALYSGLILLATAGIVITPVVHRLIHQATLLEEGGRPARPRSSASDAGADSGAASGRPR